MSSAARRRSYYAMHLLLPERAPQYQEFIAPLNDFVLEEPPSSGDDPHGKAFTAAVADILRSERAAIVESSGALTTVIPAIKPDHAPRKVA